MFGIGRSSISIYNELSRKALSVASVQELGDSSIKRILHRTFNTAENFGDNAKSFFRGNVGKMSDGLLVSMPDTERDSYNILTSIVLEHSYHGEIDRSNARFGNNKDSVFIYINGYKVPDSVIHMYMTDSHTNFIISKRYFNSGENDILIERRRFNNFDYGGTYLQDFNDYSISFPISKHRNLVINEDTVMVFADGVYLAKEDYISNINYSNNTVNILFNQLISGNIEIFIDSSIKYNKSRMLESNQDNIVSFYLDDSYIDPIYGPINKDNCVFFINGLRMSNLEIVQKSRLHYHLPNQTVAEGDKSTTLFTDSGLIKSNSFKIYGDDYFIYNFFGTDVVDKILLDHPTSTHFDDIDMKSILHIEQNVANIEEMLDDLEKIADVKLRIQELLKRCPYLLKDFLEIFSSEPILLNVNYNGLDESVTIGVNVEYTVGTKVIRAISVNGVMTKIDEFIVNSSKKYWNSVVSSENFKPGNNIVEISESTSNNYKSYEIATIDRYETTDFIDVQTGMNYEYRTIIDKFGLIHSIDDVKLLAITKREFDPDGIYFDDSQYGFKEVKAPMMIIDDKLYISFGAEDPRIDMLVVTTLKHHKHVSVVVDKFDYSYDSLFNNLYCGTASFFDNEEYHDVKIPLIHDGVMLVHNRNKSFRLFDRVDYYYKTPIDTDNLRNSGIILKREFEHGDIIDIVFIPEYKSNNRYPSMHLEDLGPNKYALMYLAGLKFPYSPKYVKIYANNHLIQKKDIDILSNKLIRLHDIDTVCSVHEGEEGETCPNCVNGGRLQNIFIDYAFKASFIQLEPFLTDYQNFISEFEDTVGKIFNAFNIYNRNVTGGISYETANYIYENIFDLGVDSNGKTPNNIIVNSFITPRYDLYLDAYMRWYISDRCNHVWRSYKYIPENILRELDIFRDSFDDDSNRDVVLRPEKRSLMQDIEVATRTDWYQGFTRGGTIKNFLECCEENGISIQECFKRYEEFKHSNRVFKRDLLPISALQFFDGEDIVIGRGPTSKP